MQPPCLYHLLPLEVGLQVPELQSGYAHTHAQGEEAKAGDSCVGDLVEVSQVMLPDGKKHQATSKRKAAYANAWQDPLTKTGNYRVWRV